MNKTNSCEACNFMILQTVKYNHRIIIQGLFGKRIIIWGEEWGRTVFRTIGGIKSHKKQKIGTYSLGSKAWDTLPKSVISNRAQSCWNSGE